MTNELVPPRPFSIRRATFADARGILGCLGEAFAPYRDAYTPAAFLDTTCTPATIHERLSTVAVFVATDDAGEIVGTVGYILVDRDEGHVRGMAVLPSWQGQGVADELLKRIEQDLRELRCARMTLGTTKVLERAMRFYERNGFRRHGESGDFFGMELFEYVKELV